MIGEGVLSLLIVETTESKEYFTVSCFGVLTVMGIHVLIFESQPSTSQGHAVYRSLRAQMLFGLLVQILSMALIAFGVCFKIMLTTIVLEETSYESDRRLATTPAVSNDATTALFSGSLTIILITLELMLATHKGAKGVSQGLFKKRDGGDRGIIKKINKPVLALSVFKIGLIVFAGTISQWEKKLTEISIMAFLIIVAMSACRGIGWGLVHKEDEILLMLNTIAKAPKDVADSMNVMKKNVTKQIKRIGSKVSSRTITGALQGFEGVDDLDTSKREGDDDLALQRTEWRSSFRPAWDSSFDCMIVTDRIGIIQYANNTAVNEFRYGSANELVGKDIALLTGGGEAKNHHLYMKKMEDGREPSKLIGQHHSTSEKNGKQRILHACRKDGSEFPCMIGLKSVPGTESIVG
jgi:PAS domain S-box-containing protein